MPKLKPLASDADVKSMRADDRLSHYLNEDIGENSILNSARRIYTGWRDNYGDSTPERVAQRNRVEAELKADFLTGNQPKTQDHGTSAPRKDKPFQF